MNESRKLDQFYTKKAVAENFYNILNKKYNLKEYKLIEPSAGTGSFSSLFHKNSIALDLDPKSDEIIKQDFLNFDGTELPKDNVFVVGNPPFGKNSSLAIKFFNKSAEFADYIAFILPQTFKKESVINKLNINFHLVNEIILQKNSFEFNNEDYDVPCVFQVWEKRKIKRENINSMKKSKLFNFVKKSDADFAIRRVGGLAGKVILDFESYKEPSHYYIKVNTQEIGINELINKLISIYPDLQRLARYSAGNPSLSKGELIRELEK
jgi:predicted RNA methylase